MLVKKGVGAEAISSFHFVMIKKSSQSLKRQLVHAGEHSFWVCGGYILHNLLDLKDALLSMDNETFTHHVNSEKNDFAQWVDSILLDSELAQKLTKNKTASASAKTVEAHLKKYY